MPCGAQHHGEPPMDHWGRRQFVQGVAVAGLGLLAGCGRLPGQAQSAQTRRLGYLRPSPVERSEPSAGPDFAFRDGLRELGYVEGQNLAIEWRLTSRGEVGLQELAAELVQRPI